LKFNEFILNGASFDYENIFLT